MAHESAQGYPSELDRVHREIEYEGYALTSERGIGLPPGCAQYIKDTYFDGGHLRCDESDRPHDRERARDVIRYEWKDGELTIEKYETIAIRDRCGIKGERIHKHIELSNDGLFKTLIRVFLSLVPEALRESQGTFAINLFRTHTDVVTKPHRDGERFIITYVLGRDGDGAESYLYRHNRQTMDSAKHGEPVFWKQLNAGDLLIFDDDRFKHGATPLTPPPGGQAKRDVLVCTVDLPTTYLWRDLIP